MDSRERRFRDLYDRHHRAVLAYFLRRTDHDSAYECTEDVYLTAWRRLDDIPDGDVARRWLYGVSRRVLANHRRSTARRNRLITRLFGLRPDSPPEPEPQVIRRIEDEAVLTAIGTLSLRDQEVLRLAYWDDLPHAQIAEILGCSTNAVDVRLHRAVRRLEKGLKPAGQEHSGRPAFLPGRERQ